MGLKIVPTSDEDPALSIVRFTSELAWADAGPEVALAQVNSLCLEAQECMVMGRWFDLVSLLLTSADLIFSKVSEKDLECIFTVICGIVTNCESLDEALEIAKLICSKLNQNPDDRPGSRLKILFNLYNLLENPYSRFYVYKKALGLAINGKVTEYIIPSFKNMEDFLREWNIQVQDQRELFLTVSNILRDNKSDNAEKDSFKYLSKYLASFCGEDPHSLSEAKGEAVRAVVEFVKSPTMFQCDFLDIPAVTQLENDVKYSEVYQLLEIFLTRRLDAYLDFEATHSDLMNYYGIVHEDCVEKMRLMSLVDLCSDESGCVSYSLISDTLRINLEDVERWAVKAIAANLMNCKMDQMNEVVIVSRCMDRAFGLHQWKNLRTKLAVWRGNVANAIKVIQANKINEEVSPEIQGLMIH